MVLARRRALLGAALLLASACFSPTGFDPTATGSSSGGPGSTTGTPATDSSITTSGDTQPVTSTPGSVSASGDPTAGSSTTDVTATTAPASTSEPSSTGATTVDQTTGQLGICGDGKAEPGVEECDDANAVDDDGCASCQRTRFLVFTTQMQMDGTFGGFLDADLICQQEALAAGKQGLFRAWLSVDDQPAVTRLTHADGAPYVRSDGEQVALDWNALIAGGPEIPIDRDAAGNKLSAVSLCTDDRVWTGTDHLGQAVQMQNCNGWTLDMNVTGTVGGHSSGIGTAWTHCGTPQCFTLARLYCFEQPLD